MTIERMIELLKIEQECVLRKARDCCDRCEVCDLVQDDRELNEMYTGVIAMLEAQPYEDAVNREAAIRAAMCALGLDKDIGLAIKALPSVQPVSVTKEFTPSILCSNEPDGHNSRWYACGACNLPIGPGDRYCRYCGKAVKWG